MLVWIGLAKKRYEAPVIWRVFHASYFDDLQIAVVKLATGTDLLIV